MINNKKLVKINKKMKNYQNKPNKKIIIQNKIKKINKDRIKAKIRKILKMIQ